MLNRSLTPYESPVIFAAEPNKSFTVRTKPEESFFTNAFRSEIASLCPDIPVVFTGDLNDNEGGVMYDRIIESGMRDSKYLAEKTMDMGTYHGYSKITELTRTKPIDFVFVNAYCKSAASYGVLTEKYDGNYSSDHHPLRVELTLAN